MPTVLVTAGPTREHLDDVRFLSNGSTGRMGYEIAAAARAAGCEVILVSGPTALQPPEGVTVVPVVSACEMLDACERVFARCDLVFAVAAVADHRPKVRTPGKPAKHDGPWTLELVPNPDVVATLARVKGRRFVVGFALEAAGTEPAEQIERALAKLTRKNLDLIVLNEATAMGGPRSTITVLDGAGQRHALPPQDKADSARWLVEFALRRWRAGRQ
ncbi:MAG TPA: phosphopantothenoylcysteine decarboxylase [Planctomycetota bacterium]|nr:phosphopantothenoylcysteine decarboxylase [Planctomycetota bacterium]